jgi:hypothetical protein
MFILGFIAGIFATLICLWLALRNPPNFLRW